MQCLMCQSGIDPTKDKHVDLIFADGTVPTIERRFCGRFECFLRYVRTLNTHRAEIAAQTFAKGEIK